MEKLLADALFQRLGKSMDKFEVVLNLKEYGLAVERAQIQEMFLKGESDKAEAAIREYEKKLGEGDALHWQFIALQKAELYRRKGERIAVQRKNVLEGLLLTVPKMEIVEGRLILDMEKFYKDNCVILSIWETREPGGSALPIFGGRFLKPSR